MEITRHVFAAQNLNELKTLPGLNGSVAYLEGRNTFNDGWGGVFMWDSASTETPDNVKIIQANGVATGRWKMSINTVFVRGSVTFSSVTLQTAYVVNHNLGYIPSAIMTQPTSANAAVPSWISNITSTTFTINFASVPILGTNNMSFTWMAFK